MKVYFVSDSDDNENCMIFRDKASAKKYLNSEEFEGEALLHTIDFVPNKKGIIRAMEQACSNVGASICENEDL